VPDYVVRVTKDKFLYQSCLFSAETGSFVIISKLNMLITNEKHK